MFAGHRPVVCSRLSTQIRCHKQDHLHRHPDDAHGLKHSIPEQATTAPVNHRSNNNKLERTFACPLRWRSRGSLACGNWRTVRSRKAGHKEYTHYFWVRLMFISMPFNLNMLSSSALVCSEICPGFAGASLRGSLSTMISKSTSFSVRVDMSFSKQKAYSPTVFAVRT